VSQQNVEVMEQGIDAWNKRDTDRWISYAAPEVEWMPAGPAAVERTVYRGHEAVVSGLAAVWETWDTFEFRDGTLRDLGDSVLWLGYVQMRGGASGIDLRQEFAILGLLREGKMIRVSSFLTWEEALAAAGESDQPVAQDAESSPQDD
jgi:ketosteroid isomerase-like protein